MLLCVLGIAALFITAHAQNDKVKMDEGKELTLFDFTKTDTTDHWIEVSDTKRDVGMSKGVFTMQNTQVFSRAIFFSLLNPQPNGACFAGVVIRRNYNLSNYTNISLKIRGQGENKNYKIVLRHKGQNIEPFPTYEQFLTAPIDKFDEVTLPLSGFRAYYRGRPMPNAESLDVAKISSIGIQIYGGVYEDHKQKGASSLEIDWIKATK